MSRYVFSNSILDASGGAWLSSPAKGCIALLNNDLGAPAFLNYATGGAQAADKAPQLYSSAAVLGDQNILMFGTNEATANGTNALRITRWIDCMRAFMVWRAAECKVANPANGVTFTGSWATYGAGYGSYGTSAVGAKAAFSVTGQRMVLGFIRQQGNTATFKVTIDGTVYGPFDSNSDVSMGTSIGFGPMALTFDGLSNTAHAVEVELLSTTGGNVMFFHWFSSCAPKAKVVIGNIPGSRPEDLAHNAALPALVVEGVALGLDVSLVDVHAAIVPADMYDVYHPNDSGQMKMRGLYYTGLTGLAPPVLMSDTSIKKGSDGFFYAGAPGAWVKLPTV